MDYTLVYEVTEDSSYMSYISILFVVVGVVIVLFNLGNQGANRSKNIVVGSLMTIFSLIFSFIVIPGLMADKNANDTFYENGDYDTVEGEVENYLPAMQKAGRQPESFTVKSIPFEYADSDGDIHGFHQTQLDGGPITGNGQKVRIGYIIKNERAVILKLEIAQSE